MYQLLTTPFFLTKATVGATNAFEKSNLAGLRYFSVSLVFQCLTSLSHFAEIFRTIYIFRTQCDFLLPIASLGHDRREQGIRVTKIFHTLSANKILHTIRVNIPSADKMKCSATKPCIISALDMPHHSCHAPPRPESYLRITHKHPLGRKMDTSSFPIVHHARKRIPTSQSLTLHRPDKCRTKIPSFTLTAESISNPIRASITRADSVQSPIADNIVKAERIIN